MTQSTGKKYEPGIKAVKDYFGMTMEEMRREWTGDKRLTDADKAELAAGAAEALNAQA